MGQMMGAVWSWGGGGGGACWTCCGREIRGITTGGAATSSPEADDENVHWRPEATEVVASCKRPFLSSPSVLAFVRAGGGGSGDRDPRCGSDTAAMGCGLGLPLEMPPLPFASSSLTRSTAVGI